MSSAGKIINMSIAGFIFASVGAAALLAIADINTSGLDASTVVLLGVVTIAFVLGVVILFLKDAGVKIG